jgi:hypothetical protein
MNMAENLALQETYIISKGVNMGRGGIASSLVD